MESPTLIVEDSNNGSLCDLLVYQRVCKPGFIADFCGCLATIIMAS